MKRLSIIGFFFGLSFISITFSSQESLKDSGEWEVVGKPKSFKELAQEHAQLKEELNKAHGAIRGLRKSLIDVAGISKADAEQLIVEQKSHAETQKKYRFERTKHRVFKDNVTQMYQTASAMRTQLMLELEKEERNARDDAHKMFLVSKARLAVVKQRNARHRQDLAQANGQIQQVTEKLEAARGFEEKTRNELRNAQTAHEQLQAQSTVAQAQRKLLEEQLNAKIAAAQKDHADTTQNLYASLSRLKDVEDHLTRERARLNQSEAEKSAIEQQLRNEMAGAQAAHRSATSALNVEQARLAQLQTQLSQTQTDKTASEQQFRTQLAAAKAAHDNSVTYINGLETRYQNVLQSSQATQAELDLLKFQLNNTLAKHTAALAQANSAHATTTQTLQRTAAELATVQAAHNAAATSLAAEQVRLAQLQRQLTDVQAAHVTALARERSDIAAVQQSLQRTTSELETVRTAHNTAAASLAAEQTRSGQLQSQFTTVQNVHTITLRDINSSHASELAAARSTLSAEQARFAQLQRQLTDAQTAHVTALARVNSDHATAMDAENRRHAAAALNYQELYNQLNDYKGKFAQAQSQAEKYRKLKEVILSYYGPSHLKVSKARHNRVGAESPFALVYNIAVGNKANCGTYYLAAKEFYTPDQLSAYMG